MSQNNPQILSMGTNLIVTQNKFGDPNTRLINSFEFEIFFSDSLTINFKTEIFISHDQIIEDCKAMMKEFADIKTV